MTRLLVVEDNPDDRELVRRCLADDTELELVFANDGAQALEMIAEFPPDMVLTDLRMPEIDGLELVERVTRSYPGIPVILMTALGSEQVAMRALRAGASSYVPKRKLAEELEETVRQVLEIAESHRARSEVSPFLSARVTRFELPTDLELIPSVVIFVQDGLAAIGFGTEAVRSRVGLALMEGLANAIVRGNLEIGSELRREDREAYDALIVERSGQEPYGDRKVSLTATESGDAVEYVISDEGCGFDPSDVPDPTAVENLLAVSGRGIMLMRTFMDVVEFSPDGRTVTLSKRAGSADEPEQGASD